MHGRAQERLREFESQQMVTIRVGYVHNFGFQISRTLRDRGRGGQGCTGDFERNLRWWPKSTVNGDERPAGGDIQGSGKLQGILPALVPAPDKNRNSER